MGVYQTTIPEYAKLHLLYHLFRSQFNWPVDGTHFSSTSDRTHILSDRILPFFKDKPMLKKRLIYDISDMLFDKKKRKEFRERILRDEMLSIGHQFHTKAMQWLTETRKLYTNNSAEFQIHPNRILSELKRINHERAYIAYKISALAKGQSLPPPNQLRQKLRKLEMEIQFQDEFPEEYKQFMKKLKKCLRRKPYTPNMRMKRKNKNLEKIPNHWNMGLGKPIQIVKDSNTSKTYPIRRNKVTKIFHGHRKASKKSIGHGKSHKCTKNMLEKMLKGKIPNALFHQLKKMRNKQG